MSRAFATRGWHVGVHYGRNKRAAEATLRLVHSAGGIGDLYQADVRDPDAVRRMVEVWRTHTDAPTAFVCNAGIAGGALLIRHSEQTWHDVIATNLTGVFYCLRAVAPVLMAHGGGSIIVVGSHTGFHGATGQAAYATSKAGLIGLVRTAAWEWGPHNIRVNLVLPGWQKTNMTKDIYPKNGKWLDHALRRPTTLEEAARTIVYLTELEHVSGQIWNCDSRLL